jgi:hypothetical protein
VTGGPQDEHAFLETAPRETAALRRLGAIGTAASGAVVALVGLFLIVAAVQYDPNETVGLDGALDRRLDESYGRRARAARGRGARRVRGVLDRTRRGEPPPRVILSRERHCHSARSDGPGRLPGA